MHRVCSYEVRTVMWLHFCLFWVCVSFNCLRQIRCFGKKSKHVDIAYAKNYYTLCASIYVLILTPWKKKCIYILSCLENKNIYIITWKKKYYHSLILFSFTLIYMSLCFEKTKPTCTGLLVVKVFTWEHRTSALLKVNDNCWICKDFEQLGWKILFLFFINFTPLILFAY